VAEILIVVSTNGGNWSAAFEELIPKRKGAKVKGQGAESADGDEDNEAGGDDKDADDGEEEEQKNPTAASVDGAETAPVVPDTFSS
jgi:tRNA (guanine9-N1)-methyltransferase